MDPYQPILVPYCSVADSQTTITGGFDSFFCVCKIHDRDNRFVLLNTPYTITPRLLLVRIPIPLFKTLLDVHYGPISQHLKLLEQLAK